MKYVIGNWKMNTTVDEAVALAGKVEDAVADLARAGHGLPTVVICPPFTALSAVGDVIREQPLALGAQDCHWEDSGSRTGEIGAAMLKGLVEYVLIGHSERRAAGESDELIGKKLSAAERNGLIPILFVGEQESSDDGPAVTEKQLRAALAATDEPIKRLLVVYEPVWEVGGEALADPSRIAEVVDGLSGALKEEGVSAEFLYGGSVTQDNASGLVEVKELTGLLVGHESLNPAHFATIIETASKDG